MNREPKWKALSVAKAGAQLLEITAHQLAPITVRQRPYTLKTLDTGFGNKPLGKLRLIDLERFQRQRTAQGKQPATINAEISVLKTILRRANLWHRFHQYKPMPRRTPPPGRALSPEEVQRVIASIPAGKKYQNSGDALMLAISTGMRSAEIKQLRWQDTNFLTRTLSIRHSKTPAGWREIQLNDTALAVFKRRYIAAAAASQAESQHFVFPSRGDPSKPLGKFHSGWATIRKRSGVNARFHDLRHTAVTAMLEAGISESLIRAQVGHSTSQMTFYYSHPRTEALKRAADALDPINHAQRLPPQRTNKGATTHDRTRQNQNHPETRRRKSRVLR